jgi:hypothetical protein
MNLEEKFQKIQANIDGIKSSIQLNEKAIVESIQNKFSVDYHIEKINQKRFKLLEKVDQNQLNALRNTQARQDWDYFKYQNEIHDHQNVLSIFIGQIGNLGYENDFEFCKKLRFYNLYNFTQKINLDERSKNFVKVVVLNTKRLLAYDNEANELILMDRKFNRLKVIKIERDFNCFQISKISDRIVINLVTHVKRKTFIYVFDFELSRIKSKLFKNQFIFFKSSQNMFFFRNSDLQTYYLHYNLDLEMVGKYEIDYKNRKNHGDLNSILGSDNRFIFNCRESQEIKILTKEKFEVIKAIPVKEYAENKLFVDTKSNLFLLYKKTDGDFYHLNCYDKNGNFLFSQSPIFSEYFQVFKNYETIYLYDDNSVLKCFL